MSSWTIAIKALHSLGGEATTDAIADATIDYPGGYALQRAKRLGLVRSTGRSGNAFTTWTLTKLGRDYAEGRVKQVTTTPGGGGRKFVATWLHALPRGISIHQREKGTA